MANQKGTRHAPEVYAHPRRTKSTERSVLAQARIAAGFTQKQVADAIGTIPTHISMLERNRSNPSIPTLKKMGELFGVPWYTLVEDKKTDMAIAEEQVPEEQATE